MVLKENEGVKGTAASQTEERRESAITTLAKRRLVEVPALRLVESPSRTPIRRADAPIDEPQDETTKQPTRLVGVPLARGFAPAVALNQLSQKQLVRARHQTPLEAAQNNAENPAQSEANTKRPPRRRPRPDQQLLQVKKEAMEAIRHHVNALTTFHLGHNEIMLANYDSRRAPPGGIQLARADAGLPRTRGGGFTPLGVPLHPAATGEFKFSRTQTALSMDPRSGAASGAQRWQRIERNSQGQVRMDSNQREFDRW